MNYKKKLSIYGILSFFIIVCITIMLPICMLIPPAFGAPNDNPFDKALNPIQGGTGLTKIFEGDKDKNAPKGISEISGVMNAIGKYWKIVASSLAIAFIVIAGFRMVISEEEETIKQNKTFVIGAITGLVFIMLADVLIKKIIFGESFDIGTGLGGVWQSEESIKQAVSAGQNEIFGVIRWIQTVISAIAVIVIVLSAVSLMLSMGNEENIKKQQTVFLTIGAGLVLLAFNTVFVEIFYNPELKAGKVIISSNAEKGIAEIIGIIQFILGFVAILAFAALIYGGFLMVMYWGNEQGVEKAKNIIRDAVLGLILIFSAYAIAATFVTPVS